MHKNEPPTNRDQIKVNVRMNPKRNAPRIPKIQTSRSLSDDNQKMSKKNDVQHTIPHLTQIKSAA